MSIKGVIVAAGYGTRFLPVTRTLPKEMLPLVDRPALDFIVQEFAEAGIEDVILLTSRRKKALDDWFDRDPELEGVFTREGATAKLEKSRPPALNVAMVRQREMLGAGHALLQIAPFVGEDPVVVAYPDDLFGAPNCSRQLIDTYRETGCSVLACHDLPEEDLTRYGILDVEEAEGARRRVRRLVEKPPAGEAPSSLVSLGRYLYTPELFAALRRHWERHDPSTGEYYPMAATNDLAAEGKVVARIVDAPRWDTGAPLGFLKTMTEIALAREDLGEAYRAWLKERLG